MAGMVSPQPDPKQQLDPAHPLAPPAANQTTAGSSVRDAINSVTPQGAAMSGFTSLFGRVMQSATAPAQKYADGTANVQPARPAAPIDVIQRMQAAGMPVQATQSPATPAIQAAGMPVAIAPPTPVLPTPRPAYAPVLNGSLPNIVHSILPANPDHAGNMLSAATGVPAHWFGGGGSALPHDALNSTVVPTKTEPSLNDNDLSHTNFSAPAGQGMVSENGVDALNNPHKYSGPDFLKALHGMTYNQISALMPILAPNLAPQEQAFQALIKGQRNKAATTAAQTAQDKALTQTYMERRAGVSPYSQIYPMQQQFDQNGNPVQ